jgi:hypothetical protein
VWPCPRGPLDAPAEHLGRAPPLVGWSRSASTSSQTAAASATSRRSPIIRPWRDRVVLSGPQRRALRAFFTSSASPSTRSARSRSTWTAGTPRRSATTRTPRSALTRFLSCASRSVPSSRSVATNQTPRALPHPQGPPDQERRTVAAQEPRQADHPQLTLLGEIQHHHPIIPSKALPEGSTCSSAVATRPAKSARPPSAIATWQKSRWTSNPIPVHQDHPPSQPRHDRHQGQEDTYGSPRSALGQVAWVASYTDGLTAHKNVSACPTVYSHSARLR